MKYGPEAVEACLATGCHYTDTNGEQNWMMACQERWGAKFAEKGLALSPGIAQMYTTGEIAAELCLETPGLNNLDIAGACEGLSDLRLHADDLLDPHRELLLPREQEVRAVAGDVARRSGGAGPAPDRDRAAVGGTAHPVWYKNDPRVHTCKVVGGVFERTVMESVIQMTTVVEERSSRCRRRSSRRRCPTWPRACRPACRRARTSSSTPRSIRCTRAAPPAACTA